MGAVVTETFAAHDQIYKFAWAYKIPSHQIDGMDLFEVRKTAQDATKHVRSGEGPIFIEAQTYRFRGHSISDPAGYRPKEEVDYWLARDPIKLLGEQLIEEGTSTEEELQEVQESVEQEIVEAVRFAEESPFPEPSALHADVYNR